MPDAMAQSRDEHSGGAQASGQGSSRAKAGLAWGSGWSHVRFWTAFGVALAGDLLTKAWAIRAIGDPMQVDPGNPATYPQPIQLIGENLELVTHVNAGAVAGIFAGRTGFLILVSGLAVGVLLWMFLASGRVQRLMHVALGLLLGGALGNMHDRVFNEGLVVDFIKVDLGVWPANPWPTFNVADVCLCVGVGLLLLGIGRMAGAATHAEGKTSESQSH